MQQDLLMSKFVLLGSKFAEKMDDLTDEEVRLWKQHLEDEVGEGVTEGVNDFFDSDNSDIYQNEIRVTRWTWNGLTLIDINAWPGDNEGGAVFFDGKIIFRNGDRDICQTDDTPEILLSEIKEFIKARDQSIH